MTASTRPSSAARYGFRNASSYSVDEARFLGRRSSRRRARASRRPWRICTAGGPPITAISARRPRDAEVVADAARVHDDVRAAVRLAHHDAQARHGRRAVRVHELGAVADHAAPLEVAARLEAGRVDERDDREVEGVAPRDEPRRLARRLDVERAGPLLRLVGDDADRPAVEAGERGDEVRCVLRAAARGTSRRRRRRRSRRARRTRRSAGPGPRRPRAAHGAIAGSSDVVAAADRRGGGRAGTRGSSSSASRAVSSSLDDERRDAALPVVHRRADRAPRA